MDIKSASERSANMAAIRSKNTKPEIIVRKALTAAGCRYRLNRSDIPGKPDIAMIGRAHRDLCARLFLARARGLPESVGAVCAPRFLG